MRLSLVCGKLVGMAFNGFSNRGLEFLTELGSQDRDWFQANRFVYDSEVAGPAKGFVEAMTDELRVRVSPKITGLPKVNGSISPINNDLRFARDATPYKDHLLFRWWEGTQKKLSPTLFVRLSADEVGFATGLNLGSIELWRSSVGGPAGMELADAIDALSVGRSLDIAGQALKRVPTPYEADHPRADLLRHKGFQVRWSEPTPVQVQTEELVVWCCERLEACVPIHRWLVKNLVTD